MKPKLRNDPNYRFFHFSPTPDGFVGSGGGGGMIVNQFDKVNEVIDQAASEGLVCFLFCDSGNDLSATVAAAYIMHHMNSDYISAIQFVQSKRFSISLDDHAKYNLQTYQGILDAKKWSNGTEPSAMSKRQIGDVEDVNEIGNTNKRVYGDDED